MGQSYNYDFPFTIAEVATLIPLTVRRSLDTHIYVDCPFCNNGKKGKMDINFLKDTYRCNYNDNHHGGMLDLYCRYYGVDTKRANREIREKLKRGDPPQTHIQIGNVQQESAELADLDVRHHTYERLYSKLMLAPGHRRNLHQRGLRDSDIERLGYKSTPAYGYEKIAQDLIGEGCVVEGVPGFYMNRSEKWTLNFNPRCSGILFPNRTYVGEIQASQIRLDRPIGSTKHFWFSSSDKEHGASSGSPMHFVGNPDSKVIYMTEGAMKADIVNALSGKTVGAVAGAGQTGKFEAFFTQLWSLGFRVVIEAYDMDRLANPQVERGALTMLLTAHKLGFETHRLRWNWTDATKGLDDRELHRIKLLRMNG